MIYLARHGQTAYNAAGRFQGWLPVGLDDTGRRQAHALAAEARDVAPKTLVSSQIERAVETAAIVGSALGLEPVVDERFAETDAGDWTDRTFAEVQAEDPGAFARFVALDPAWGFPGGETFAGQLERVLRGIEDWRAREESHPVLVVCHGNTIRLALGALRPELLTGERPANGSLVAL
jgi:broad specificity phosphatase PhoE